MNLDQLKDARVKILEAMTKAEERGGCVGTTFQHSTGRVCAIGAVAAAHLKLPREAKFPGQVWHEAQEETRSLWHNLSWELLGVGLPHFNDHEFREHDNPALSTLKHLLVKLDAVIACRSQPADNYLASIP